jgi:MYXO-CTERM domain-containing protein
VTFDGFDLTSPTVTVNLAAGQEASTAESTVHFTVVFSEPVTGFEANDVVLGGTAGATTAVVSGGPTTYDVAVSGMTVSGTISISITAGAAMDGAHNASLASTSTDDVVMFIPVSDNGCNCSSSLPDPSGVGLFALVVGRLLVPRRRRRARVLPQDPG